ncbi:hypothetical protein PV355_01450 [Streptomyces stelliscabiei]|uniref:hypothetical protein n=1 Tax=Streptomyces stelliscabiei TaxID=146820 RepID=UPI0029AD9F71|nr:hypothetical protein [Streptomyces stelliscabiei]MDX2513831.1 hypothetical protein [Streptomyces stelliscabiei]
MTISSGLGQAFYYGGYDLSGDTGSADNINGGLVGTQDITTIDLLAFKRIGLLRDGGISWASFFNKATGRAHERLGALPTADRHLMWATGTTLGAPAACLVGKQINYDVTRPQDGSLTIAVNAQGNAYGLEWGDLLTAGKRTDTAATNGTATTFGYDAEDFLSLPGASGDYASTPDAAALDIVGDIDIRVRVALADWTPAAESTLIAKYTATGNQRSYALAVTTAGALIFRWSEDGTVEKTETSSANLSALAAGATTWVRATLDADVGGTDAQVTFYTSDDGSTWTQLGAVQTVGAVTSIFASTAVLELGGQTLGTVNRLTGKIFRAQVLSGIAGSSVAAPIASASGNGITDATPRTWTVNGAAFISSHTMHGLQAYLQVFSFAGTDVTVKLQHSHDNGGTDAFADITGGGFTQITTGPGTQRIEVAAGTEIRRYVRAVTTTSGGFTSLVFAVAVNVNLTETTF